MVDAADINPAESNTYVSPVSETLVWLLSRQVSGQTVRNWHTMRFPAARIDAEATQLAKALARSPFGPLQRACAVRPGGTVG